MRILLLTTGDNAVHRAIATRNDVQLFIIDFQDKIFAQLNQRAAAIRSIVVDTNPEIIVTYRCPYILPYDVFSIPSLGAYNIHPSLLPKYPGLNPWDEFCKSGETITGVTYHVMSNKVDAGKIILQQSFMVANDDDIDSLRHKADHLAASMIDVFFRLLQ